MRPDLVRWQWEGYPTYHRRAATLWLHLVAVPVFVTSAVSAVYALLSLHWLEAPLYALVAAGAFAVQGAAHGREPTPAIPFAGPIDAVSRILLEQFFTFPRFVLTGGWSKALRESV